MLKDLFDQGFRPWISAPTYGNQCSIGRNSLMVSVFGSPSFELNVNSVSFELMNKEEISGVSFFCLYEPVPDAVKRIKIIASYFGISTDELERIVSHIADNPEDDHRWADSIRMDDGTSVMLNFIPSESDIKATHAQVWFSVMWRYSVGYDKMIQGPTKAPLGYEFAAPPEHNLQDPYLASLSDAADKQIAEYQAKNMQMAKKSASEKLTAPSDQASKVSRAWLVWLLVIFAALLGVWRLLGKPTH